MSDTTTPEEKKAPVTGAPSEEKAAGASPERDTADAVEENVEAARQRALSQCVEYMEDGESEYSHPADMADHPHIVPPRADRVQRLPHPAVAHDGDIQGSSPPAQPLSYCLC